MPNRKFKALILKFGFNTINAECQRKDWLLPFASELRGKELPIGHGDVVWVRDNPFKPEDLETHACVYDIKNDKIEVVNKSHMQNIIVLKLC